MHTKFPVDPVFDNRYHVGNRSIDADSNANNPGNLYNLRSVIKRQVELTELTCAPSFQWFQIVAVEQPYGSLQ